jgi:hypothetical protein
MSQNEERHELAVKAVNRLIADAEETASFRRYIVPDARLRENKELAEIITVCICETALPQLQTARQSFLLYPLLHNVHSRRSQ